MYPEEDWGPPRNGCASSSCSTGVVHGPTVNGAGIPGCGCGISYRIGAEERDRWLTHMRAAVDDLALPAHLEQQLGTWSTPLCHGERAGRRAASHGAALFTVTSNERDRGDEGETIRIAAVTISRARRSHEWHSGCHCRTAARRPDWAESNTAAAALNSAAAAKPCGSLPSR